MNLRKGLFAGLSICFACFLLLSISSYSVNDNCLSTRTTSTEIFNLLGSFGAYIADMFLQTFGLFTFFISLLILIWGVQALKGNLITIKLKKTLFIFFLVLGCIIFTVVSSKELPSRVLRNLGINYLAGGYFGYILTKLIFVELIKNTNIGIITFYTILTSWILIVKKIFFINFESIKEQTPKVMRSILNIKPVIPTTIFKKEKSPKKEKISVWEDFPLSPDFPIVEQTVLQTSENESEKIQTSETPLFSPISIVGGGGIYTLPYPDLLDQHSQNKEQKDEGKLLDLSAELCGILEEFGIQGEIINVRRGPVVTMFEFRPAPGIKTSRVIGLSDDIARSMSAVSARISLIPGQNAIGIEIPNKTRQTVYLRELLTSEIFANFKNGIPLILGKDISGNPIMADLTKMPHLLVAGTTGSGKSVSINDMILSILFKFTPAECRLIMVDPKMLELSVYDDIPHLLIPVVTDPKKAVFALKWAVSEMENRYRQMSKLGVRNIDGFNKKLKESKEKGDLLVRKVQTGFDQETGRPIFETQQLEFENMPYIVVIVDEMADLMLVAGKDIEAAVQRLAQMARAAGIHLIMATQRPSVDVITGTIKANFPTRISFQVTSKIDSRTILGEQGAEQLLGHGDMLYMAGGGRITRIHGPFVKDLEVERIVNYIKGQGEPSYVDVILDPSDDSNYNATDSGPDDMYNKALEIIQNDRKISISYLQRKLQIGYNRAARIVEEMEQKGVISSPNHTGKREILI